MATPAMQPVGQQVKGVCTDTGEINNDEGASGGNTLKRRHSDGTTSQPHKEARLHPFVSSTEDDSSGLEENEDDTISTAVDDNNKPAANLLAPNDYVERQMARVHNDANWPQYAQQEAELHQRIIIGAPEGPMALPANHVFPIQVGSKLFSLSGASLSSDAPSYFTRFFKVQLDAGADVANIKTLYLDRDPDTFTDISLHLQGYHVEPRDGTHFTRLFADAQFFDLPRLIQRLYKSDIFVRIGSDEFKISRDLLEGPGDSPNYFTLGFGVFFHTPDNLFPGVKGDQPLLRPPAIRPPHIQSRSAAVFADLLHVLQGYDPPDAVADPAHREAMLRDARYYHLRGLEQRLVPHRISHNPHTAKYEIALRFADVKPQGLSLARAQDRAAARLMYARPHIDAEPRTLVVSLPEGAASLARAEGGFMLIPAPEIAPRFVALARALTQRLAAVVEGELPEPVQGMRAVLDSAAHVTLDGREERSDWDRGNTWSLGKSLWRVEVAWEQGFEVRWLAVKLEAWTGEAERNVAREWI